MSLSPRSRGAATTTSLVSPQVCSFTPTAVDVGSYLFFCTNAVCGSGHSDPAMQNGLITVAPYSGGN